MNIKADRFICKKRNEEKRHIGEASRIKHEHKITDNTIQTEHDLIITNLMSKFEVNEVAMRAAGECRD